MWHAGTEVLVRSFERDSLPRVASGPRPRQGTPTPGATQIQAIEVGNSAIAAITDDRRSKQCDGLTALQPWKEPIKPVREFRGAHRASHALCLHQRRREKILTAWLPCL